MSAFYIAAAHKSSGKTTLSIGLTAALRGKGKNVRCFKKGPDYIDPLWLSRASGNACHNLDFFTASQHSIKQQFVDLASGHDVVLVEGNMGLFDGISVDGSDSNAAMAKLLGLPVILIIDCAGTSRGIAPLLIGYRQFDPDLQFAGVILNKVAGRRHEKKLREMVESHTDFTILGVVHRDEQLQLTERHLGLIPSNELDGDADNIIRRFANRVADSISIEKILQLPPPAFETGPLVGATSKEPALLRLGVAMDEAFGFYYPGDLQRFHDLGVKIIPFKPCSDTILPDNLDGLFIGGGFPESRIEELAANASMRESIHDAIHGGLPAYAECGGLMYLCEAMKVAGRRYPLCGLIPASVNMNKRPQGRGYVVLQASTSHPWYRTGSAEPPLFKAHEFHYSSLEGLPQDMNFAYRMQRGTGIDESNDGIILYNLLASYTHLRSTDRCSWVDDFVSFIKIHASNTPT